MKIAVCVCTCQRPEHLTKLLLNLGKIKWHHPLSVVVVDNDAALEGMGVCEKIAPSFRFPIHAVPEPRPGIIFARNTAMFTALSLDADFVAFLDDDEWPSPQWLSELMRVQAKHNSDAVGGPTITDFPPGTPDRMRTNAYYGADLHLPDESECQLEAAGNFVVRADAARPLSPNFFHQNFAHSCGEDLAFFTQLLDRGAHMHWAANAIVHEWVPEYRLTDSWMRKRVITIANSRVRVMQMLRPSLSASVVRCCKSAGLLCYSLLFSVAGLFNENLAYEAKLLRWKFLGKFKAHMSVATTRQEPVENRLRDTNGGSSDNVETTR